MPLRSFGAYGLSSVSTISSKRRHKSRCRDRMKAVVYRRYGLPDVLHIEDVPKPEPAEDEVLIRVHASAVNGMDMHVREAEATYGLGYQLVEGLVLGVRGSAQQAVGGELFGQVVAAVRAVG